MCETASRQEAPSLQVTLIYLLHIKNIKIYLNHYIMKYNIEGDIDFYSELSADTESSVQSDNICLITHEQLLDNHVKMTCGHTFNYIPLYNDVLNHKTKFNNMESSVSVLGVPC
jgi:hypothetical protein